MSQEEFDNLVEGRNDIVESAVVASHLNPDAPIPPPQSDFVVGLADTNDTGDNASIDTSGVGGEIMGGGG